VRKGKKQKRKTAILFEPRAQIMKKGKRN
jgi:hypothetical protein